MRRVSIRAVAAITMAAAACLSGTAFAASPAPTAPASVTPTPASPVTVLFDVITPKAPTRTDVLHLSGRLVAGATAVDSLNLRVLIGLPLARFDLHQLEQTPESPPGIIGTVHDGPSHINAGATAKFTLDVPLESAPYLSQDGVHALELEVQGTEEGAAPSDTPIVLGKGDTFLPVFSTTLSDPTHIVWGVKFQDRPQSAPASSITDASILGLVGTQGRLSRLLTATKAPTGSGSNPVVYIVDADLLRALNQASTGPWKVEGDKSSRPANPAAAGFLTALSRSVTQSDLVAEPSSNADVVSLADAGLDGEATAALASGKQGVAQILGVTPRSDVFAPAGGEISTTSLAYLAGAKVSTILLNEAAFPPDDNLTFTPSALAQITTDTTPVSTLVADQALNDLVAKGEHSAPTPRMAEQLFLAETAAITAQRPAIAQSLLVLTPDQWDPGTRFGKAAIADSTQVPWLTPSSINDATNGDPETEYRQSPQTTISDPLAPDLLNQVARARAALQQFSAVISDPKHQTITSLENDALFAAESADWRGQPDAQNDRTNLALAAISQLKNDVRVAAPRSVTLTNASSPIPVTVINDLSVGVSVTVHIQAANRTRLGSSRGYSLPVTLPAKSRKRVDIPVKVESSGTFPVSVSVETNAGQTVSDPVDFVVRSAAYGKIALFITGGAFIVLIIAVIARAIRRISRHRRRVAGQSA